MWKLGCVVALLMLMIANAALAQVCQGEQDITPAAVELPVLKKLAVEGGADAQLRLGLAYMLGVGVSQDRRKGVALFEESAKQGNAEAQYFLGEHFFYQSKESTENAQLAVAWLSKAARQSCYPALLYLGILTRQGVGTGKNEKAGVSMIKQAAAAGVSNAQWWLGAMQLAGDGVPKDERAGFLSVQQAASQGNEAAQLTLADLYLRGKGTGSDPQKATALLQHVYQEGDPKQAPMAAYMLGWTYMEGEGVKKDHPLALQWMMIAAAHNVSDSRERLSTLEQFFPMAVVTKSCPEYVDMDGTKEAHEMTEVGVRIRVIQDAGIWSKIYLPGTGKIGAMRYVSPQCFRKL